MHLKLRSFGPFLAVFFSVACANIPRGAVSSVKVNEAVGGLDPRKTYSASIVQKGYTAQINILDGDERYKDKIVTTFVFNLKGRYHSLPGNEVVIDSAPENSDGTL